jgi:hypothetical protein
MGWCQPSDGDGSFQFSLFTFHSLLPSNIMASTTDKPEDITQPPRLDHHLHDLISIGEIISALSASLSSSSESDGDTRLGIRLPLLLRWLTAAQPFATISPSLKLEKHSHSNLGTIPDAVVPLLEEVAAAHHDAENVEVLVSSLVPAICKEAVGKLPSVSRKKAGNAFLFRQSLIQHDQTDCDVWDTKALDKAILKLSTLEKRKRKCYQTAVSDNKRQKSTSIDQYLEKMKSVVDVLEHNLKNYDDEDIDVAQEDSLESVATSAVNGDDDALSSFFERASEESHHMLSIRRVLHELLILVKSSLSTHDDGVTASNTYDGGHRDRDSTFRGTNKSPWIAFKPDSLLSETDSITSSSGIGMFGLPVMISSLMHNAPILRHRHVSSALCRASIPQSATLIMHMAANCPAASSCLLSGCIDAFIIGKNYQLSAQYSPITEEVDLDENAVNIIHTSVESAKSLALLSRREACNVVRVLRECGDHVMCSLVLQLLLDTDEAAAASFIVEKLMSSLNSPAKSTRIYDSTVSSNEINTDFSQGITKRQSLPLNQRIICNFQFHNKFENHRALKNLSPMELLEDRTITEAALSCMSRRIVQLSQIIEEQICFGEASLFIRAYALLTYFINIEVWTSKYGAIFEATISAIQTLSKFTTQSSFNTEVEKKSTMDEIYILLLCATLFTVVQVSTSKVCFETVEKTCVECLELLLLHPVSMNTTVLAALMASCIHGNNPLQLLKLAFQSINGLHATIDADNITNGCDVCQWLSLRFEKGLLHSVQNKAMTIEYVLHDARIFIDKMSQSDIEQSVELEKMIRIILNDPDMCCKMLQQPLACIFIRESAKLACQKPAPHIPLVLPLSLESCSRKLWADIGAGKKVLSNFTQFVLQLLYALAFLDEDPASPFVINPRSFPLKETLAFVGHLKHATVNDENFCTSESYKTLKESILHHCPDLVQTTESNIWLNKKIENIVVFQQDYLFTPKMVCEAIHDCFLQNTDDPSGVRAEKVFFASRCTYPCATVDIAAIGAFLTSSRYQPKFVSYVALCKDPLLLLQARAAVWKCQGLRRIIIRVLSDLLSANESITIKDSASHSAALQYLTARDAVIFRCILLTCASTALVRSNDNDSARHCATCVSFMRSIASRRRGVIATLVKQGLPQNSVDFLVKFIPESFQDAPELVSILSEKEAIPLVERLVTASTALSICVASSSRGEATAKNLLSASLETLVDSFYLVIGPVGLPVSVFRDVENGQDITLMCKEITFRMIKTLSTINPRSCLTKDAIAYLTKISVLCKSENSIGSLSGAVASKRKSLLKEIWDSCDSSCRSLGVSIH